MDPYTIIEEVVLLCTKSTRVDYSLFSKENYLKLIHTVEIPCIRETLMSRMNDYLEVVATIKATTPIVFDELSKDELDWLHSFLIKREFGSMQRISAIVKKWRDVGPDNMPARERRSFLRWYGHERSLLLDGFANEWPNTDVPELPERSQHP